MHVFLHKHVKKYTTLIPRQFKKRYLKKTIYSWAQNAPVQHEKETASETL